MTKKGLFRSVLGVMALATASTILFDFLFFKEPVGWTISVYLLILAVFQFIRRRPKKLRGETMIAGGLLLGLIASLMIEPSWLNTPLAACALLAFSVSLRFHCLAPADICLSRICQLLRKSLRRISQDYSILGRYRDRKGKKRSVLRGFLRLWAIPLVGTFVFIFLFSEANPVLEKLGIMMEEMLASFFENIDILRMILWVITLCLSWGLLRAKLTVSIARENTQSSSLNKVFDNPPMVIRALSLFNAVFAVQSFLDVLYLWGGATLPEGMTYAEYAHRGAYPLVFTALISGIFVLLTFGDSSKCREFKAARVMVVAWIAQNILLLVSTAWRLYLYIDAYMLTLLRLATIIWIALVICGFALIVIRILKNRTNLWLLNANAVTAGLVLYACCFMNFGALVSTYNVRHCQEVSGAGRHIDVWYLKELGIEALPAIVWLEEELRRKGKEVPEQVPEIRRKILIELKKDSENWCSWTLRRRYLYSRYGIKK